MNWKPDRPTPGRVREHRPRGPGLAVDIALRTRHTAGTKHNHHYNQHHERNNFVHNNQSVNVHFCTLKRSECAVYMVAQTSLFVKHILKRSR